ncbi:MAG: class B sortase [Eubacterium sp.]|nr:class B sortase [Eubacterium sp.]
MKEANKAYREEREKRQKKKKAANVFLDILLVLLIAVFIGSGAYLGIYFFNTGKAESQFVDLKRKIDTDAHSVSPDGEKKSEEKTDSNEDYLKYVDFNGVSVQSKFAELYEMNNDFIGWLMIPDTKIDYPVMYTPNDEEYYLHRDYNKENSSSGTLFLGKRSDCIKPSDNVIIYGHNMKAGTMFHGIISYESEDFYKEHKTIYFDTIDNNGKYEVIAAFRTEIREDDANSFKYYEFANASTPEEFDEYVERAKKLTPYTIDETAVYGEKLLTLSTCAYHVSDGRFVVVAKKID